MPSPALDLESVHETVATQWATELIPQLTDYIAIPALSPAFDPDWEANGHIEAAVTQIVSWLEERLGLQIDPVDVVFENFETPAKICEFAEGLQPASP